MAPIKCCVVGCTSTNKTHRLYKLPKDNKLRSLWLSGLVSVNSELLGLSKDQLLNKHVCQKHFDKYQLDDKGNRLKDGYPGLFSTEEVEHGVPLSDFTTFNVFESNEMPSTSKCEKSSHNIQIDSLEKLPMCRICLVQNVRMYVVVNRSLQELYEKLTDVPFVTEDRRPILACFFCCAKLKQCYRLLRQCLEAEELFAQMMNKDYEPNPLINQEQDHFEFFRGFIKTATENISIVDECQIESIAIKEGIPAVCEGLDDIIDPKEESIVDECQIESIAIKEEIPAVCEGLDYIIEPKEESIVDECQRESIAIKEEIPAVCEGLVDITEPKEESIVDECQTKSIVVKEEIPAVCEGLDDIIEPKEEHQIEELEPDKLDNSCLDVADTPPHQYESYLEYDVPLIEFKTEVKEEQEVTKKKRRARETQRATVAKKPKLDTRRTKLEDAITAEQTEKDKSDSKVTWTTEKRTSKPDTCFKEPYNCDQRSFNLIKKNIQQTRTQIGEKSYKCDVCQRTFIKKGHLITHARQHTGEKPYKCDVCQRSFSNKSVLTRHKRTHTGEKPYKCDVCQRSFSEKKSLSTHIRIHTGEKPYKCDVCPGSFSQKSNLTKHKRIHTGEKPYKCDVCQGSFSQKITLSNHIRIHTGEKPYKCDVCQRSFCEKKSLSTHIRIHTGEKPFKCDVCQLSFRVKRVLTRHISTHTG